ncbi:iron-containing alcohol dehydrogenase [Aliiglaciecola sp. LCG003]|uniref:iron-containing alcohol dehydrogenase n=1 Tax=Aliiglaciecola sp. LCG003 TaxID=3053655 RepID=UPI002573D2E3|nr:iron-containing alcohol dehydrogenase [Aliiglaciecola sp. LCG003]WJG09491.1 iron-containing alcohol dehydrogenase [Aliiglaciecola sp. LCG003]
MNPFVFSTTPTIFSGQPVSTAFKQFNIQRGIARVLIVTDKQIHALGLLDKFKQSLRNQQIVFSVFDQVEPDPSADTVMAATSMATAEQVQMVIGFGGGSSLDVAKLVAVLASPTCEQSLKQIFGVDNVIGRRLPLVLVPTTAGTGSEVTPISIVTTGGSTKSGVVSASLLPDAAILDAELTIGLPPHITAATGIDAMVHAIEAYTSKIKKNPISDGLACNALTLLNNNIRTAVHNGEDLVARGNMLLGSMLAGQAFANSPVAGVHALAYPLGGIFHIPHGLSNALMLPHVMRFNLSAAKGLYAELACLICDDIQIDDSDEAKSLKFIQRLESLIVELGLPNKLRECGVTEDSLPRLAEEAMQQQRLLVNNPVAISKDDALRMYQAAF